MKAPKHLWDPKYAALGVVAVALAVAILDLLPALLRSQIAKRLAPPDHLDFTFPSSKD